MAQPWIVRFFLIMGTDINAAFGHSSSFPPTEELVRRMCAGIKPVPPILESDWSLRSDYSHLHLALVQSSNLSVYFGPRAAMISSGYGWPYDADDAEWAQMVATAAISIARFFESPHLIFLPDDIEPFCDVDSWISDGASIEDLERRLAGIRKPTEGFSGAIKQSPDYWEVDGYFIVNLSYDKSAA